MFRALNEQADPLRCTYVGMIEVLASCSKERSPCPRECGAAEDAINEETGKNRVGCDLDWVLVKRGQDFNATWAVVNLVEYQPETIGMTESVPPIEDECAYEPVEGALDDRILPMTEVEQGMLAKVPIPQDASNSD